MTVMFADDAVICGEGREHVERKKLKGRREEGTAEERNGGQREQDVTYSKCVNERNAGREKRVEDGEVDELEYFKTWVTKGQC